MEVGTGLGSGLGRGRAAGYIAPGAEPNRGTHTWCGCEMEGVPRSVLHRQPVLHRQIRSYWKPMRDGLSPLRHPPLATVPYTDGGMSNDDVAQLRGDLYVSSRVNHADHERWYMAVKSCYEQDDEGFDRVVPVELANSPDITDVMDALHDDYLRYGPAINDMCCVRMASQVDEDEEYGVDWDEES